MKIAIAKSLLEPVGIPWETVYRPFLMRSEYEIVSDIIEALRKHFDWLRENNLLPDKGKPSTRQWCPDLIAESFEAVAENHGAVNIHTPHYEYGKSGHSFWIEFGIPHKMGNRFSDEYSEVFFLDYSP